MSDGRGWGACAPCPGCGRSVQRSPGTRRLSRHKLPGEEAPPEPTGFPSFPGKGAPWCPRAGTWVSDVGWAARVAARQQREHGQRGRDE